MRREEIVVVGGGIAGTATALAARERGASVTLIDEQPAVGGYLRSVVGVQPGLPGPPAGNRGFELAEECWNMLYDADVNVQLNSTVWGMFEDNVLGIVNPETSYRLKADTVVLATGSTDVVVPFTGWELAGVMTARAALRAINIYRVLPGGQVAIVGEGPDAVEVRESFELAGAGTVVQAADPTSVAVGGQGQVEWIELDDERREVEVVVTAFGVQPDPALALQIQAGTGYSEFSGVHVPLRDEQLRATVPGLYVVGDAGGICTTDEAWAEGVLAGEAVTAGKGVDEAMTRLAGLRSPARLADLSRLIPPEETS